MALVVAVVAGALTAISGDTLGKVMFKQQPMKMAAAEALWDGQKGAPFSIFAVGDVNKGHNEVAVDIPNLLSFLATDDFTSYVGGINDVNKAEQQKYGPGDYRPNIPVAYWGFRWMIGFGVVSIGVGAAGLWLTRRRFWVAPAHRTGEDEVPHLMLTRAIALPDALSRWYWRIALLTMVFPLLANSWGWIFTETGRQPWVVYGVLRTKDAVSPGVSVGEALTSLLVFTALYAVLAVVEVRLLAKYVKAGPPELTDDDRRSPTRIGGDRDGAGDDRPMAFSY
jgi:cytochrome d ubiquinol oxidase subunit I